MKPSSAKRKFKFNFIDVILIFIILAAVALLVYIFMSGRIEELGSKTTYVEYQVSITGIREEYRGKVTVGDKVVDAVKLMGIGDVVDVQYEANQSVIENVDTGEMEYVQYPEHLDMTITIKAEATYSDNTYTINGYTIAVGTLVSIRVPNFTESGYCTTIREVK